MARKPVRGAARVAFLAHLETIKDELAQGWTAKAVYQRLTPKLGEAISYAQFVRYCRDVRPDLPVSTPRRKPQADPSTQAGEPARHAGHESAVPRTRTFKHSPVAKEGEADQLLGPGY